MQILGQDVSLKENLLKSIREHWFLWSVLLVTAFYDFASTVFFMSQYGIRVEKNMVVRWLATTLGIVPGVLVGKALQIMAVAAFSALSLKYSRAILLLIVGLNLLAILANLFLEPSVPAH